MAEIDDELIARTIRWCAEAGRQATAAEARAALAPLTWDELLAARALLADPPPARPLGPHALADLARGAPADVAAERQREGRYHEEPVLEIPAEAPAALAPDAAKPSAERRPRARRRKPATPIVIRRASERAEVSPAPARVLPLVDELMRAEGRSELERLVRRHGGRRAAIEAELAAGWRHGDGTPASAADLVRLLEEHGLARVYERRERDEALHALRVAGGMAARAAAALGVTVEELPALLARTGAQRDAERIRAERRDELRRRATLAERARLLTEEHERLADLEILTEFEDDFRARLPEHLRALRASGEAHLVAGLARTLSLPRPAAEALARRLQIAIADDGGPRTRPPASFGTAPTGGGMRPPPRRQQSEAPRPVGGDRPQRPTTAGPRPTQPRLPRSGAERPRPAARPHGDAGARPSSTPRHGAPRAGGSAGPRPSFPRAGVGAHPTGDRPRSGPRPGGTARPGAPRSGPRPGGTARPGAPRSGPRPGGTARPGAPRSGPRPGGTTRGAPRSGPRPGGPDRPRGPRRPRNDR